MNRIATLLSVCLVFAVTVQSAATQEFDVLPKNVGSGPAKQMMQRYLKRLAYQAFEKRSTKYENLKSPKQIEAYQRTLRDFFISRLGGMPEKTPLNAKIVGRLKHKHCCIEKVIFESRPRHYVTATLYLPFGKPPYPGVLVPCGHTANGKAGYQRVCIFLAKFGFAALCYDPIGQGERYQLLADNGKPRFRSTTEHTLVGVGSILVGRNTASYRIWDGIRALDYLQSRDDIDGERLGCTGNSGGGTLTEYLMALDPRIRCAAPACAPCTFQRRIETIGPGDAEQNIFGQIAFGLDHADYAIIRAPRPTLLLTATRDFVDIQGAWNLYRDAHRIYTRLGHPEKITLIEADEKHGFTQPLRTGAVRWMRRWLLDKHDPVTEPDITTLSYADIQCTPKGQVQLMKNARSVMDFNFDVVKRHAQIRKNLWSGDPAKALSKVRDITGIRPLDKIAKPKIRQMGTIEKNGYSIEKIVLEPENGIWLPGLLYHPKKSSGKRILYVHGLGKQADTGPIENLVHDGHTVFAVDLRGAGETGSSKPNMWGGSFDDIFTAYLLGKSFLAMRAEDVLTAARFLGTRNAGNKSIPIRVVAVGTAGPPALHAVALERPLFAHLTLRDTVTSWIPVMRDPTIEGQLVNAVHGALTHYDLADLLRTLPNEMVTVEPDEKK